MIKPISTQMIGKSRVDYFPNGRFIKYNGDMIKNWGILKDGRERILGRIQGSKNNYTVMIENASKMQKSFVRKSENGRKEVYTIIIDKVKALQTKIYSSRKNGQTPIIKKSVSHNTNPLEYYWSGMYIR